MKGCFQKLEMNSNNVQIRPVDHKDMPGIYDLYIAVASTGGNIARNVSEISREYITAITEKAMRSGLMLVATEPGKERVVASIKAFRPGIELFDHILNDFTILVHPSMQGKGIGKLLFRTFLKKVEDEYPHVLRVELFCSEKNTMALQLYEKLGFVIEGRFEKRVKRPGDPLAADIAMAWFNPTYRS